MEGRVKTTVTKVTKATEEARVARAMKEAEATAAASVHASFFVPSACACVRAVWRSCSRYAFLSRDPSRSIYLIRWVVSKVMVRSSTV